MSTKVFNRSVLDKALTEAGYISSPRYGYHWITFREREGRLVSPRDPVTGMRKYTNRQIWEIVQAFSPTGIGFWKFKKRGEDE